LKQTLFDEDETYSRLELPRVMPRVSAIVSLPCTVASYTRNSPLASNGTEAEVVVIPTLYNAPVDPVLAMTNDEITDVTLALVLARRTYVPVLDDP